MLSPKNSFILKEFCKQGCKDGGRGRDDRCNSKAKMLSSRAEGDTAEISVAEDKEDGPGSAVDSRISAPETTDIAFLNTTGTATTENN
jgi:hypothetical protein